MQDPARPSAALGKNELCRTRVEGPRQPHVPVPLAFPTFYLLLSLSLTLQAAPFGRLQRLGPKDGCTLLEQRLILTSRVAITRTFGCLASPRQEGEPALDAEGTDLEACTHTHVLFLRSGRVQPGPLVPGELSLFLR